ncbi:MAG: HAMP domain-containing sensor histidine kinase [Deltaproteobacteria bacterium]|nr:HAMP domain-containing sensor histidine kinase [Deltaproteobacteria bacterium]
MTRLLISVRTRLAIAGVVLVLVLGAALFLTAITAISAISRARIAAFAHLVIQAPEEINCRLHPARFDLQLSDGSRVVAFDPRTGHSLNPNAPALDRELFARHVAGERDPARLHLISGGGAMLVVVAREGPCGMLQIRWGSASTLRQRVSLILAATLAIAIAIAFVVGALWVVRPMLRRVERAALLASRVGLDDGPLDERSQPRGPLRIPRAGEDELASVDRALREAHDRIVAHRREIEAKNHALATHLADVAHDLKTPLASLQLSLDALARKLQDPELSQLAMRSLGEVVYLDALVNNLRVASELEEGQHREATLELGALVDRVSERIEPLARRKQIELAWSRPDNPVMTVADSLHLERALSNLVHNAIAHHDQAEGTGHVAVVLEIQDATWEIFVSDDGPGVPPTSLPSLANRRGEVRSRDGQGLGLAIVAAVCANAQITLTWETEVPRGLRAVLRGKCDTERSPKG